jgi:hypothetical protein
VQHVSAMQQVVVRGFQVRALNRAREDDLDSDLLYELFFIKI